ncbi:MAG TPA: flagellar hook-length control protein FliK, partial [Ideonella sp.]|nr:flagellar hook-length control protein FliK [Ideonella sp.]
GTVPATTPGSDPIVLSPPIRLPAAAPVPEQRQALAAALGERLQVQIAQRSEHAVIRIEPPSMGSIEIAVRHEGGNLQVHMNASHGEVQRQLQQIGDSLKQELAQRHSGEVSVQVGGDARDADGRQRQRHAAPDEDRAAPGRALADAQTGGDTAASRFTLSSEPS